MNELHASEILLLAYYIACASIEVAYRNLAVEQQMAPEGGVEERVLFRPSRGSSWRTPSR